MSDPKENSPHLEQEEVHLNDYLNVLYRRHKTVFAAFAVVFLGVVLYTFGVKPVYEASATLHVRDEKVQGDGLLSELGMSRDNPIETELQLLKSRTNIEEVVRRLRLNWHIEDAPEELDAHILEFSSAAEEPTYTINLLGDGAYEVENCRSAAPCRGREGTLLREEGLSLLIDRLEGPAGESFTLTLEPFNRTVAEMRDTIGAGEVGKGTSIIRASYRHTDPELASRVVNTLAEVYLERTITLKTQEARKSVTFIESQLEEVGAMLDSAEKNLESYKSDAGIVHLDSEIASIVERMTEAEQQRSAAALKLRQVEFAIDAIGDAIENGRVYSPSVLGDDAVVAALSEELAKLEVERRAVLTHATERHPEAKQLQERINELQRKLLATYKVRRTTLATRIQGLDAETEQLEGTLRQFPEAEQKLARLTRLATVNADIYTFLLKKHEEARIARAATISNINVI
ncbi:MAG: GumC family protein, partial [Desulfuromonadales bacterium]|nr:GumC family protein [Desulfuromonadales bacterium]NIR33265.1 GumC family protein [Desulfuromonadales bacterium]NIS42050.1 GumC family protein [Desulfuromonadales bacterium]